MNKLLIIFLLLASSSIQAASYKDSYGLKVNLISVWSSSGEALIQTSPRHSIEDLSCTNDYWLVLDKTTDGYDAILSLLLTAQSADKYVTIRAIDDNNSNFCRLERVIIHK